MKNSIPVTIELAKQIAGASRSDAIIIIQFGDVDDGTIHGASFGADKKLCRRGGRILDAIVKSYISGKIKPI